MSERADIVIVGGGQAGLASAHVAREAGLAPVVLEAGDEPVGSWPRYYESLTLFSPARYSDLPGRPFGGDPERYPTRDELIDYLRGYAADLDADIRCGGRVESVRHADGDGLTVTTNRGDELTSDLVVAATGGFGTPYVPAIPGLASFDGPVTHTADYRSPAPFAGQRVVVVGGGNSAVQIAAELAEVARVTIATRAPLKFRAQRPLGRDLHWWLKRTGLDTGRHGRLLNRGGAMVLDDGRYRASLATGNPDRRPLFAGADRDDIVWPSGERERVDAIILATGYRPNVGYLAGIGALDADGSPLHERGVSTAVPGLGYVGLSFQRSFASATVRGVGRDAAHVVARLRRQRARRRRPAASPGVHNPVAQAP